VTKDWLDNDLERAAVDEYHRWNRAVAEEVFAETQAHRPVYLDLEPAILGRIASSAGWQRATAPDDLLVQAVQGTLHNPGSGKSIFRWHIASDLVWHLSGQDLPPPVLALLAVFSLAAEQMQRSDGLASNNYYHRLTALLGFQPDDNQHVQRDYRHVARRFWESLNYWLRQQEGRRGLPTAQAFDRRVHVGLSLSQALVREQDRARLPEFFLQYGLQPGQNVSLSDMQDLLDEWMPRSTFTPSLRKLWQASAAREQIAEVSRAELEGWDGKVPADIKDKLPQGGGLRVALELHGGPHTSVQLMLVARHTVIMAHDALAPADGGCSHSAKQLLNDANAIRLTSIPGSQWLTLEVTPALPSNVVLAANIALGRSKSETTLSRGAKRVVPMKYDRLENMYVEVSRVELLEEYAIACHHKSKDAVERLLSACARSGWEALEAAQLNGLPDGWSLFRSVQLERISHADDEDLVSLCPMAGTQVVLHGGFQLPGRKLWHVAYPPELCVVAADPAQSLELHHLLLRYMSDDDSSGPTETVMDRVAGGAVLDLSNYRATCLLGDHQVIAYEVRTTGKKGRPLSTVTYRMRSADARRNLTEPEDGSAVVVPISNSGAVQWPLCAQSGDAEISGFVSGARLHVTDAAHSDEFDASSLDQIPRVLGAQISEEQLDTPQADQPSTLGADSEQCLERGHHHWIIDPVDPDPRRRSSHVYEVCRDCGLEKWIPARKKRGRNASPVVIRDGGVSTSQVASHPGLPPIGERPRPDMDLLLDAVTFSSGGSWRSFRAIASQVESEPWFPREAARRLSALGHMEVVYDSKTLAPVRWSVAPATIVVSESGRVFLAGQRPSKLVNHLADCAAELDGRLATVDQADGPSVVELQGLDVESVQLVAAEVSDRLQAPLPVTTSPATQLAMRLPTISSVRDALPKWPTDATPDRFLNLTSGTWEPRDSMEWPGAYRIAHRPGVYVVLPNDNAPDRTPTLADSRLAKYIASNDANTALVAYEEDTQRLTTPFHAPLPELYERVAVLSSGYLSAPLGGGARTYADVAPRNATQIWKALAHQYARQRRRRPE